MDKPKMPSGAATWYIIANIFSLGFWYFLKITIMKALADGQQ